MLCASDCKCCLPLHAHAPLTGLLLQLKAEKLRLDGEKAEREKYDAETARLILVNLLHNLSDMTDDDRFSGAVEALTADP